ncbi:MAG: methyltransferase domain-containing protein, partial [Rhodospirillaceae bacterium]
FNHMMAQIGQDWSEHTLVDFGSGKGRVLILAAELGFKRAIGVELSPELAATAQRNIAAYAARQAPKTTLESANVDARDFALPDGPVVLYFYSPFPEALVAEIVERARQSLRACPRDMVICYAEEPEYPIPDVFACDSFKALSVAPIPYDPGAIRQLHFAAFRALG